VSLNDILLVKQVSSSNFSSSEGVISVVVESVVVVSVVVGELGLIGVVVGLSPYFSYVTDQLSINILHCNLHKLHKQFLCNQQVH
jgi:hypothetical protein